MCNELPVIYCFPGSTPPHRFLVLHWHSLPENTQKLSYVVYQSVLVPGSLKRASEQICARNLYKSFLFYPMSEP